MPELSVSGKEVYHMYDGNELWRPLLPLQMQKRKYGALTYDTYAGLPENLYEALCRTAARNPDKICIVDDDGTEVTFGAFVEKVDAFAAYLRHEVHIRPGDHVALMMFNSLEFCVSFLAIIKAGAVCLPLPSKFRQQEVLSLLEKADPNCIICDEKFAEWMEPLKSAGVPVLVSGGEPGQYALERLLDGFDLHEDMPCLAQAGEPAILMFTSGTTSLSKGVVLTNFNVMHAVATYQKILDITPEDSTIIAVPIYHVTGMIALLGLFLYAGGTVYLHRMFRAERVLQCVKDHNVTFIHGAPTVFSMLLQQAPNFPSLPSLRAFACGSSNMPKAKILALHEWLPNMAFRTVYGLTETSSPATIFPCDAAQSPYIGSSGLPVPGTVFRVMSEDGRELPPDEVGEIQLKGSVVLREYYKMKIPALSEDGWLATGDLGYFNKDGYIFLVDRKKDMINRGGEKICSYDVENELYHLPGIEEAAVVGIPDEVYGEVAAAVVKCSPGVTLTQEQVQSMLHDKLAKYKIPAKILFLPEIPTTPNGKIDKKNIRNLF